MFKQTTPYRQIAETQTQSTSLKRAVFYPRVSTLEQDRDEKVSREVQIESAQKWFPSQGYGELKDTDIFFDASTGTNTDRPGLTRIRQQVKAGRVSVVVVWKIDRLARSLRDFVKLIEEFDQYGVVVRSITEPFDTGSHIGRMIMALLAIFAEFDNVTRRDRLFGGRMKKVERDGNWIGGTPPFGFKLVAHMLVAVPEAAEIVVFIFKTYLEFKSISRVVLETKKEFARRGIEPPIKLDRRQIGRMLNNQLYTGRMYIKRHKKLFDRQTHDVIIDIETFNRVQLLLKKNYQGHKLAWSVRSPGFLFRDRAICGHCESAMVAHHAPVHLRYYSCNRRRKEGAEACVHKKNHRQEKFDESNLAKIIEHLTLIISQPGYLEEKMSLISLKETNDLKKKIKDRRIHLSKVESFKEKWRRSFEEGEIDAKEMTARIKRFDDDCLRVEQEIMELEAEIEDVFRKRTDVNKAKQFAREFEKNFEYASNDQKRDMVNAVVKVLRVFNDSPVEMDFNF